MIQSIDFDEYINKLCHKNYSILDLDKLATFFKKKKAYLEYAVIKEHEFHLSNDIKKLEGIGNLYLRKIKNKNAACRIFMLEDNKEEALKLNISQKFISSMDTITEAHSKSYAIYILILSWFLKNKEYDSVKKYIVYDKNFKQNEFLRYIFSKNLSATDDFDMNNLAIEYNNGNNNAWFNIFDILCIKNETRTALYLYNLFYPQIFIASKEANMNEFYMIMSDLAFQKGDFFKQVLYQSKAINYE